MLKKILLSLLVVVVLLIVVGFFLPKISIVERTMLIKAKPEVVFGQINNLKNWEQWSPWHQLDKSMKINYANITTGKGASYTWSSENDNVGSGTMRITQSSPNDSINMSVDFGDHGTSAAKFILTPDTEGVTVKWIGSFDMGNNPLGRYFGLMMNKFVGGDYEKGLNNLRVVCEQMSSNSVNLTISETKTEQMAVVTIKTTSDLANIAKTLGESYQKIGEFIGKNGLKVSGHPFSIYHSFSHEKIDMEPGMAVDKVVKGNSNINVYEIPTTKVIRGDYYGSYEGTEQAHELLNEYIKTNSKKIVGSPWEVYVTDPMTEKDTAKWLTEIYYPVE